MSGSRCLARTATLFTAMSLAPLGAFAADVGAEIANAEMHAGLAAQGSDVATVHMHLHHTLNCLVGPNGSGFDAKELNPCQGDGDGAIPDETDAAKKKALEDVAAKAISGIAASDLTTAQHTAGDVASALKSIK